MTPQQRAELSAKAMMAEDRASPWLGISLDGVGPGTAEMSLVVEAHHCNGHHVCHGGYIFTLADTAFAFACNSYNQASLAHQNSITFCAPGQIGDHLIARAVEVTRAGRSGVYDVTVSNQDGTVVALMRGNSRTIKGTNFDEEAAEAVQGNFSGEEQDG
ncbi:MAG: hydroxyphenylacetyl-CoA thioesterase PaaI [Pseudomonadota bacterium]